ncbi:MAG: hypothetical protein GY804_13775 [Alphaproteobacteria bacterium]|nr:hypothetical protein [Alphaproteobacteria bacterium]
MAIKRKRSDQLHYCSQSDNEHGRSMIEMLGVLAIVGVLSAGALAGYSQAMTNYKVNQAIDEIKTIIMKTKETYADKSNYVGLGNSIASAAGILPADFKNTLGNDVRIFDYTAPYAGMVYFVKNKQICQKILLAGLELEMGNNLLLLTTYDGSSTKGSFRWGPGMYQFPVTIQDVQAACELTDEAIGIYFK